MRSGVLIATIFLLICTASGQQDNAETSQAPEQATISSRASRKLHFGEPFTFQLRLNPAPKGFGGGHITCTFQHEALIKHPFPGSSRGRETGVAVPIEDGVALYNFSLPIGVMESGTWYLTNVSIGRAARKNIPFTTKVQFEVVPMDPIEVALEGPAAVQTGSAATITARVTDVPEVRGCGFILCLGTAGGQGVPSNCQDLELGKRIYSFSFSFLPDEPSLGPHTWNVSVGSSRYETCPQLPVKLTGVQTFRLVANAGLVTPASADITISPSQKQLLRAEAERLVSRAEQLRAGLMSQSPTITREILVATVKDSMNELSKTESTFREYATVVDPAAGVFFDDIRRNYSRALQDLEKQSQSSKERRAVVTNSFLGLTLREGSESKDAWNEVVSSVLHNVAAYNAVVSAERLTFNLSVKSDPQDARVFYRRSGDEYMEYKDPTNSTIPNLPIAVWFVRLNRPGYKVLETRYDATTETSGIVQVKLMRGK